MRWLSEIILLLFLATLVGCSQQQRKIVGSYRLEQWEDFKTYYLDKKGQENSGGGIINGVVLRIGWNDRYIVAERHANYRGDSDGWMIIDVKSDVISGPFNEADFHARPEAKDIQIYEAGEAWKKL